MASRKTTTSIELQHAVEQWYYREARLLDGRQYQSWLALCALDIHYIMPGRGNPLVDNDERGEEAMISVDRELEGVESDGLPVRDERHVHLAMRVDRAYKPNAWAENPPARTRRIVGNVEIVDAKDERLHVVSNFHLHYARPGSGTFFYAGQRRDELLREAEVFRLARREVIMNLAEIDVPTLSLIL